MLSVRCSAVLIRIWDLLAGSRSFTRIFGRNFSKKSNSLLQNEAPAFQIEAKLLPDHPESEPVWAALNIVLMRDEHGDPLHFIADVENITDRKKAESGLIASEARYRLLAETSPEMIFVIEKDDRVSYVNKLAASQFGKTPEEVIGEPRSALFPPVFAEKQRTSLLHVLQTGEPIATEAPVSFLGKTIWLDTQLVPIEDNSGEITAVMGISRDITERRHFIQTIQEEKAYSDSIINSMPGIFYMFDEQGNFLRWNKNFEIISGCTPDEIRGRSPLDFFSGDDIGSVAERIKETFIKGESHVEAGFTTKSGETIPFLFTGIRVALNDKNLLIGTGIDMTEKQAAEEKLQASEAELRALFAALQDVIIVYDLHGRYLKIAPTGTNLLYKPPAEMEGRLIHDVLPAEIADYLHAKIRDALQSGEPVSVEYSLLINDQIVWFSGFVSPMTENSVVLAVRDISERIQAEENVRSVNERFELAVSSADLGVWDWDIVQNILTWDDQMYAQYGLVREENPFAYEAWLAGVHPDDRTRSNEEVQQALQGEKDFDTEFRVVWPDGTVRYIKGYAYVKRDADGSPTRMIGVNFDITQRKQAEQALMVANEELLRSNSELERFAYVASHDLQEPLRMVTSYLQLLERRYKGMLDSNGQEFIMYAVDGSNRMKALIEDLLSYSRIGTRGKDFTRTDFEKIFGEVLSDLQISITETNAEITHDPLPELLADDIQIASLLRNLISNAIKFRSEQPPKIHIGVQKGEKYWTFSVSDNGIGIDQQYYDRIFIIFQRLHNRENYSGTGIGLAISKRIVERHGGRIWIESKPNKGSTFFFTLPAADEKR